MFFDFRDQEERGGERETLISCFLYVPQPGIKPKTIAMCPDQGSNPQQLVYRMMFQPTETPGQSILEGCF